MRLQAQEEEVMLLKSVLRDVLQRLQNLEIHSNPGNSCKSASYGLLGLIFHNAVINSKQVSIGYVPLSSHIKQ